MGKFRMAKDLEKGDVIWTSPTASEPRTVDSVRVASNPAYRVIRLVAGSYDSWDLETVVVEQSFQYRRADVD